MDGTSRRSAVQSLRLLRQEQGTSASPTRDAHRPLSSVLSVRSLGSERESGTPSTAPVRLSGWTVRSGTSPGTRDSLMELKTSMASIHLEGARLEARFSARTGMQSSRRKPAALEQEDRVRSAARRRQRGGSAGEVRSSSSRVRPPPGGTPEALSRSAERIRARRAAATEPGSPVSPNSLRETLSSQIDDLQHRHNSQMCHELESDELSPSSRVIRTVEEKQELFFTIRCPSAAVPGDAVTIAYDGHDHDVLVPPGTMPGHCFRVRVCYVRGNQILEPYMYELSSEANPDADLHGGVSDEHDDNVFEHDGGTARHVWPTDQTPVRGVIIDL